MYRMSIERKALRDIALRMSVLDDSCGVLGALYLSSLNYFKASSKKMEQMVMDEVNDGMIEKIIAQKYRVVPAKKGPTKRKWYSSFMDDLVRSACKFHSLFVVRCLIQCEPKATSVTS